MDGVWLLLMGLAVGCFGTLIGAGGGFILAPILYLMHPHAEPEQLAAVSLAVVCGNALVGSLSYWRQGQVDVRSGISFACAAVPAAIVGVWINIIMPRALFAVALSLFLVAAGIFLIVRRPPSPRITHDHTASALSRDPWGPHVVHDRRKGSALAAVVGVVSSILGIGGGIIHVPALVHLLGFPVHVATATSHMVVAITAATGTAFHLYSGSFRGVETETIYLAVGAMLGSPIGAALSRRIRPIWILRAAAVALIFVGLRVLWTTLS